MSDSATEQLAEFSVRISWLDLPDEVVTKAKLLLLDSIGCGLGGSQSKLGNTAVNALAQTSHGNARLLGRRESVNTDTAAFLNAMLINALDFDDCSAAGHVSSTLVGTLLALIEQVNADGRELLVSYVAGYEVCARIAQAAQPSAARFAEVWGLGTNQTFGAVISAARLRRLDRTQTLNAMGIAGASAPVPSGQKWGWESRPLTWIKDAVAFPAQVGVTATTLAAAGFPGCKDILDGPRGFWRMAGSDQCDFDLMTRGLGSEYYILDASFKTYSCCWFIHPTLDAIKSIVKKQNLSHRNIKQIDVWSLTDLSEVFDRVQPEEMVDAQFSLPYCVALVLLGIPTGPGWFNKELYRDEEVLSIGSKVRIHPDSKSDEIFHGENRRISSRVVITTNTDESFEEAAPVPRGSPTIPISEDEITEKYLELAVPVLGRKRARELHLYIMDIESQAQTAKLAQMISAD